MLTIPGHLLGAYFFVRISSKIFKKNISKKLLCLAILSTILLDLDALTAPLYGMSPHQHHRFITHTPFFWIIIFGILYVFCRYYKPKYAIFLFPFFVAILTHLILDTPEDGIMWLYPFSNQLYGLYYVSQDLPTKLWIPRYLSTPPGVAQELLIAVCAFVVAVKSGDLSFVRKSIKGNLKRFFLFYR